MMVLRKLHFLIIISSFFLQELKAEKLYSLKEKEPVSSFSQSLSYNNLRPFPTGSFRLSDKLDKQKPLGETDYSGFIYTNSMLIGSLNDDKVTALSLPYKNILWETPIQSGLTTPIFHNGNTGFIGDRMGYVYKVDLKNGQVLWKTRLDSFVSRPFSKVGEVLLCVTGTDTLYRLNEETGQILWAVDHKYDGELIIQSHTAPLILNNVIYHGTLSGELISYNAETGKEIWKENLKHTMDSFRLFMGELGFFEGNLLFARYDGTVGSLQLQDPHSTIHLWENGTSLSSVTASAYRSGIYYVGTRTGHIAAYFAATGKKLWSASLGVSISTLTPGENQIYVTGNSGFVASLNTQDGAMKWYDELGQNIVSSPFYMGTSIYFATPNKNLYGYHLL